MLLPCDWISFLEFDVTRQECPLDQTFPEQEAITQLPEGQDAISTLGTGCCSRYCGRTYTSSTKSSSANDTRYPT